MRVGLLADHLDRQARGTGVGAYVEGLIAGLDALEPDDRLVAFSLDRASNGNGNGGAVERRSLPWPRRTTTLAWFLGFPRIRDVGGRLDLLHILVPTGPVAADSPVVATVHDLMPLKHPRLFRPRERAFFQAAVSRIRRRARHVIAVSQSTKQDVVELLGFPEQRVTVVPHGVPLWFSQTEPAGEEETRRRLGLGGARLVLFVGEVTARKNVVRLVEAFAAVQTTFPDARLVLVGSPGLGHEEIVATIERFGLGAAVVLTGHLDPPAARALVGSAELLVLPSLDEGFGFPALEAMSVGTPVIASNSASLPEVVDDAGLLVDPGDTEALAGAIERLLADDSLRAELGARGLQRARSFSWPAAARQTLDVYADALS